MITLRNLTLRRGAKVVLQGATVTLNPGEKAGLVGRNGAGKSSLFALLAGRLQADAGDVEMPPRWRIGEVAQQMPETDDGATDFVLQGDLPLVEARRLLDLAEASNDGHAIADAHLPLDEAGALRRPAARAGAAARPGLQGRPARRAGEQLLRRLAHAAAAGARADVPGRPAAARRADQPPRPRRAGVAGRLAAALCRHAGGHQPRPRVPRRDHRA